jgi:hypothetical protein
MKVIVIESIGNVIVQHDFNDLHDYLFIQSLFFLLICGKV